MPMSPRCPLPISSIPSRASTNNVNLTRQITLNLTPPPPILRNPLHSNHSSKRSPTWFTCHSTSPHLLFSTNNLMTCQLRPGSSSTKAIIIINKCHNIRDQPVVSLLIATSRVAGNSSRRPRTRKRNLGRTNEGRFKRKKRKMMILK